MTSEQDPLDRLLDYLHATPAMRSLVAEIEDLAEEYAEFRDRRMAEGRYEKERKTQLIELMEAHNLTDYNRDGIEIRFETEKKLKVKVQHEGGNGTDDTDSTDTADGEEGGE